MPDLVGKLGLFLDEGLIRCRGRIDKADTTYAAKFPILLPKKHWLTTLLVEKAHSQSLHGGVRDTLCKIRESYWIPQGRQSVKTILRKCYTCKVIEGHRCSYPSPPPLPQERVSDLTPFEVTGVDYTGAITIDDPETGGCKKIYVVLFTCATTRAVHLELAVDMSADTFLNVFRRFVARRSCPKVMISDNGTNFQLGSNLLSKLIEEDRIQEELTSINCIWKFIAPRAPWQGGFYERMVGIVKSCLRKVLFKRKVNVEDLYTVIAEVENRVNNRPLTYISDDINELEALTPSHLLYGRRLETIPSITTTDVDNDPNYLEHEKVNERYKHLSKIINTWQEMWKKDYLTSLREKFYGVSPKRPLTTELNVGDVVIVQGNGPRTAWPLGRIEEKYPDEHGNLRLVKLRMKSGTALRTVEKLIPLECAVDSLDSSVERDHEPDDPPDRPARGAATRFRDRLRTMIDSGDL